MVAVTTADDLTLSAIEKRLKSQKTFEAALKELQGYVLHSSKGPAKCKSTAQLKHVLKRIIVLLKSRYSSTAFWQAANEFFLTCQASHPQGFLTLLKATRLNAYNLGASVSGDAGPCRTTKITYDKGWSWRLNMGHGSGFRPVSRSKEDNLGRRNTVNFLEGACKPNNPTVSLVWCIELKWTDRRVFMIRISRKQKRLGRAVFSAQLCTFWLYDHIPQNFKSTSFRIVQNCTKSTVAI